MNTNENTNQNEWIKGIKALIDDPAHKENPLRPVLIKLYQYEQKSQIKLKRLMDISDGYGHLQVETLIASYEKQALRLEKVSRISDRYQENMRELNEQLKQAALYDPLTKLANRRLFLPRLKEEKSSSQRSGAKLCLAMLDVDHFKRFNDNHGHEVGDIVLCRMARAIDVSLRDYDLCARWGGEEFIVLLPNTSVEMAMIVVERVRENVHSTSLMDVAENITLTVSIGLTVFRLGEDYNDTIKRADAALQMAKRSGRNRVEVLE